MKSLHKIALLILTAATLCPTPSDASDEFVYGRNYVSTGEYAEAVNHLKIAAAQDSLHLESWRLLGFSYKMLDSLNQAVEAYERILQIDSVDYDSRLALGTLYAWEGRTDQSVETYQSILKDDSADVEARLGKAKSLAWGGKLFESQREYRTALKFLPDYPPALLGLAQALAWEDRFEEAAAAYRRILTLDSTISEANIGLGNVYYWSNRPFRARPYAEKALALDPQNREALALRASLDETARMDLRPGYSYQREADSGLITEHEEITLKTAQRVSDYFELSGGFTAYSSFRSGTFKYRRRFDAGAVFYPAPSLSLRPEVQVDALSGEMDNISLDSRFNGRGSMRWLCLSLRVERTLYEVWSGVKASGGWSEISLAPVQSLNFTGGYGYWRLSDDNEKTVRHAGISYRILRRPEVEIAARNRYWDFKRNVIGYYTPMELSQNEFGIRVFWNPHRKTYINGSAFYSLNTDHSESVWLEGSLGTALFKNISLNAGVTYFETEFDYKALSCNLILTLKM